MYMFPSLWLISLALSMHIFFLEKKKWNKDNFFVNKDTLLFWPGWWGSKAAFLLSPPDRWAAAGSRPATGWVAHQCSTCRRHLPKCFYHHRNLKATAPRVEGKILESNKNSEAFKVTFSSIKLPYRVVLLETYHQRANNIAKLTR